jgi:hypothetical protein
MIKLALTIATLVLTSIAVQAGCATANLKGTWYATGTSIYLPDGTIGSTDQCKFVVSSSGSLSSSSCSSRYHVYSASDYDANGNLVGFGKVKKDTYAITSGKFSVTSECSVSGNFKYKDDGETFNVLVERSKMDNTKSSITMLTYEQDDPEFTRSYTLIKR